MTISGDEEGNTPIDEQNVSEDPKTAKKNDGGGKQKKGTRRGSVSKHQGPALILPKEDWLQGQKVNIHCKTQILETLRQKMSEKQKKMLDKSCFSSFLNLPTKNFPTQLLQNLLRRRVSNRNKDVLSFNLEGAMVDFSIKEFSLITGLNCEEVRYINVSKLPKGKLEIEFFKNFVAPRYATVKKAIEEYNFSDDNLSVQLAKLAILESIVVARLPGNKIDTLHIRLLEDDEQFEAYPWGRVAYNHLVQGIENSVPSLRSSSMTVTGFAYALVYWAYEIIPKLSTNERYGRRIGNGIPRIMNWDVHHIRDGNRLQQDIFNSKIVVVPIEPTEDEFAYEALAPKIQADDGMDGDSGEASKPEEEEEEEEEDHMYVSDARDDNTEVSHSSHQNVKSPHARRTNAQKLTLYDLREITLGGFSSIHNKMNDILERLDRHLMAPNVHHTTMPPSMPDKSDHLMHPNDGDNVRTNQQVEQSNSGSHNTDIRQVDNDDNVFDGTEQDKDTDGRDDDVQDGDTHKTPEDPVVETSNREPDQDAITGIPPALPNADDEAEDAPIKPLIPRRGRSTRSRLPGVYEQDPYTSNITPNKRIQKLGRGAGAATKGPKKRKV